MPQDFRYVDPRELRLPSRCGADPFKLQRQIARCGASSVGMPAPWVYEASDGVLVLYNGITRSTRVAKLAPGHDHRGRGNRQATASLLGRTKGGRFPAVTPTTQLELIEKLADIHLLSPDIRFGQLLANLGFLVEDQTDQPLREIEDHRLLEVMEKHRGDLARRYAGA
jgi:hypothetical protein